MKRKLMLSEAYHSLNYVFNYFLILWKPVETKGWTEYPAPSEPFTIFWNQFFPKPIANALCFHSASYTIGRILLAVIDKVSNGLFFTETIDCYHFEAGLSRNNTKDRAVFVNPCQNRLMWILKTLLRCFTLDKPNSHYLVFLIGLMNGFISFMSSKT